MSLLLPFQWVSVSVGACDGTEQLFQLQICKKLLWHFININKNYCEMTAFPLTYIMWPLTYVIQNTLQYFNNPIRSLDFTLCGMDLITWLWHVCRLYDDDTNWLVGYDPHYYRRIKHHQHALVVNKKSMLNHTFAVVFFVCAEKSGSGKRERDKCRVDFMSHFYWLVSKHTVQGSCCIVGYLWSQDRDNSHLWTSLTVRQKNTD